MSQAKGVSEYSRNTPKLLRDERLVKPPTGGTVQNLPSCTKCEKESECIWRYENNLWVACEIPDEMDMRALPDGGYRDD